MIPSSGYQQNGVAHNTAVASGQMDPPGTFAQLMRGRGRGTLYIGREFQQSFCPPGLDEGAGSRERRPNNQNAQRRGSGRGYNKQQQNPQYTATHPAASQPFSTSQQQNAVYTPQHSDYMYPQQMGQYSPYYPGYPYPQQYYPASFSAGQEMPQIAPPQKKTSAIPIVDPNTNEPLEIAQRKAGAEQHARQAAARVQRPAAAASAHGSHAIKPAAPHSPDVARSTDMPAAPKPSAGETAHAAGATQHAAAHAVRDTAAAASDATHSKAAAAADVQRAAEAAKPEPAAQTAPVAEAAEAVSTEEVQQRAVDAASTRAPAAGEQAATPAATAVDSSKAHTPAAAPAEPETTAAAAQDSASTAAQVAAESSTAAVTTTSAPQGEQPEETAAEEPATVALADKAAPERTKSGRAKRKKGKKSRSNSPRAADAAAAKPFAAEAGSRLQDMSAPTPSEAPPSEAPEPSSEPKRAEPQQETAAADAAAAATLQPAAQPAENGVAAHAVEPCEPDTVHAAAQQPPAVKEVKPEQLPAAPKQDKPKAADKVDAAQAPAVDEVAAQSEQEEPAQAKESQPAQEKDEPQQPAAEVAATAHDNEPPQPRDAEPSSAAVSAEETKSENNHVVDLHEQSSQKEQLVSAFDAHSQQPVPQERPYRYNANFIWSLQNKCLDMPSWTSQMPHGLIVSADDQMGMAPMRSRDLDRRQSRSGSTFRDDGWRRQGSVAPPMPPMGMPGMMPPPRGGRADMASKSGAGDRWLQRGPLAPLPGRPGPPPPPYATGPQAHLHHTANAYRPGQIVSEDPEEEKRQKQIKSVLNKLTPEKYEKLFAQLKTVQIASAKTLQGLITQIFDKALIETTFSSMYAKLCKDLSAILPEFENPADPKKPITFRRLLLNTCQDEFNKGKHAMEAVRARENQGEDNKEEKEEGEITDDEKERRRQDALKAQADLKARRRSLGNMQFIGYLFAEGLLTVKIMHECTIQLLSEEENPRPEDMECLCRLMSTIGRLLEAPGQKMREYMPMYFERMKALTKHPKLDSRIRFMIQDVIEMRDRGWEERRKQEGPKKISEIHEDARRQEMMARQRSRDMPRSQSRDNISGPDHYYSRGAPHAAAPVPRRADMDRLSSSEIRVSRINMQDDPATLRLGPPAGSFGRRAGAPMHMRPAAPTPPVTTAAAPAVPPPPRPPQSPPRPAVKRMDDAAAASGAKGAASELFDSKDETEVFELLKALKDGGADMGAVLKHFVTAAFDIRGADFAILQRVVQRFMTDESLMTREDGANGLKSLVDVLCYIDLPVKIKIVGNLLGDAVLTNTMTLQSIVHHIATATPPDEDVQEDEDTPLVDNDEALPLLAAVLNRIKDEKDADTVRKLLSDAKPDFSSLLPSSMRSDDDVKSALNQYGIAQFL